MDNLDTATKRADFYRAMHDACPGINFEYKLSFTDALQANDLVAAFCAAYAAGIEEGRGQIAREGYAKGVKLPKPTHWRWKRN